MTDDHGQDPIPLRPTDATAPERALYPSSRRDDEDEAAGDDAGGVSGQRRPRRRGPLDAGPIFVLLLLCIVLFPMISREKLDHSPNDGSRWNTVFYLLEYGTYAYIPDWVERKFAWNGGRGKLRDQLTAEELDGAIVVKGENDKDYYFRLRYPAGSKPATQAAPATNTSPATQDAPASGEASAPKPPRRTPEWVDLWNIGPFGTIDMIKVGDRYYSSKPPLLPTVVAGVAWCVCRASGWIGSIWGQPGWSFANNPWTVMRSTLILVQVLPFLLAVWLFAREVRRHYDRPFVRNFCIAAAILGTYLTPYLLTLNNHVIAACMVMYASYAAIRILYDGKTGWHWFALAGFFAATAAAFETWAGAFAVLLFLVLLKKDITLTLAVGLPWALIPAAGAMYTNYITIGSVVPAHASFDDPAGPYFYNGSYWHENESYPGPKSGMDALHEDKGTYVFHNLIGHHGFFLLTPIFAISLLGMLAHLLRPRAPRSRPLLALFVLLVSAAAFVGYIMKTHNYGGGCQGPREIFWLIPLWLLMLPAGAELLGRIRLGRGICYLMLAISLFSVYWALPQVEDKPDQAQRPWSDSWAHLMFRKDWMPDRLEINY